MHRRGLLIAVSGPSGTGKGTVLKNLRNNDDNIKFSISATTRAPREDEIEGKNYFFKTVEEFKKMVDNGEIIEWDYFCGNYYGTPGKYIEECIENGHDVILEITVSGAINIKKKYPDCVLIFLLPPSFDELKNRIITRGTEDKEVIEKRLRKAFEEIQYINEYDYVVINDNIKEAAEKLRCIISAEKSRTDRNIDILKHFNIPNDFKLII